MLAPAQEPGRFLTVTLCSLHGAVEVVLDRETGEYLSEGEAPPSDTSKPQAEAPCVFATAAPLAAPEQAAALTVDQTFVIATTFGAADVFPGRGLAAPPPWSTGPPSTI